MNRKKWYTGMGTVSPLVRLAVLILGFIVAVFIAFKLSGMTMDFNHLSKSIAQMAVTPEPAKLKCGMSKPCPVGHFSFKMWSGAANVIGPRICLEDELLMSHVLNNVGRGINIAVVDGKTGKVNETTFFDMWQGNVADFTKFLKEVKEGFIVMMASFDDPGTKLNDEAKKLIDDMGSTYIHGLDKRDSWLFVGGKGLQNKSPFEQHLQNDPNNNKFDGWPDVIVMEGCLPQREH